MKRGFTFWSSRKREIKIIREVNVVENSQGSLETRGQRTGESCECGEREEGEGNSCCKANAGDRDREEEDRDSEDDDDDEDGDSNVNVGV